MDWAYLRAYPLKTLIKRAYLARHNLAVLTPPSDRGRFCRSAPSRGMFPPMLAMKTRLKALKITEFRAKVQRDSGYVRVRFRHLFPPPKHETFSHRVMDALWPWERHAYPGKYRLFSWLCGTENRETGKRYLWAKALPAVRYRILAGKLRVIAGRLLALADEADRLADERPKPVRFQRKAPNGSGVLPPEID